MSPPPAGRGGGSEDVEAFRLSESAEAGWFRGSVEARDTSIMSTAIRVFMAAISERPAPDFLN
jgi:hypothetical protein